MHHTSSILVRYVKCINLKLIIMNLIQAKIFFLGIIYVIGAFLESDWDPMHWHWAGKLLALWMCYHAITAQTTNIYF